MSDIGDFEAEGTLPVQDNPPGISGDNDIEGAFPPSDAPLGAEEFGVTAHEERRQEPLAERVLREEPDIEPGDDSSVGRLVEPDHGMVDMDREASAVALESEDDGGLSAEEAAMHITDSP